ncbi:MAG: hypothetical protein ACRD3J_26595, partial [Thermoanaerobaculia bacterium]
MRKHLRLVLLFLVVASGKTLLAQCTPDDTPLQCWRNINGIPAATVRNVATTNTGSPTVSTEATAAALRDFMSLFTTSVDTGTVITSGTSVTVDWNIPFPFVEDNDRVKVQSVFSDPEIAADTQTALGSNTSAAKSTLTNFDDISTVVYYDPVNQRFGRSIAPHIALLRALDTTPLSATALQALGQYIHDKNITGFTTGTKFSTITDPDTHKGLISRVEAAANAEKQSTASSSALVKALTIAINNQPQAYVGAIYHYRNALAGPDEFSAKGTLEVSYNSLNQFLRNNNTVCSNAALGDQSNARTCGDRLIAFTNAQETSQPNGNSRLSCAIEYKQARGETVDLSSFGVVAPNTPITRPEVHSLIYSLTWGRPLPNSRIKDARVDLAINYNNISNDPSK